ncbi:hypothetical protein AAY473_003986 [Plecturocebus cupreus]
MANIKITTTPNVDKDGKLGHSCVTSGNVKWYSPSGKEDGERLNKKGCPGPGICLAVGHRETWKVASKFHGWMMGDGLDEDITEDKEGGPHQGQIRGLVVSMVASGTRNEVSLLLPRPECNGKILAHQTSASQVQAILLPQSLNAPYPENTSLTEAFHLQMQLTGPKYQETPMYPKEEHYEKTQGRSYQQEEETALWLCKF